MTKGSILPPATGECTMLGRELTNREWRKLEPLLTSRDGAG
jgi:hypothetical protein